MKICAADYLLSCNYYGVGQHKNKTSLSVATPFKHKEADIQLAPLIQANYAKGLISFKANLGLDFCDADLSNRSFKNQQLDCSIFTRTNLENVNFENTYLHKSYFNGAFMPYVKMNEKTDCSHCNFNNAWLCNSKLNSANMYKSNFIGANLSGADINNANMKNAVFDYTTEFPNGFNPEEAGMIEIKKRKNLSNFDFNKMSLRYNDLSEINFSNSNFEKADLRDTDFSKSNLQKANLKNACLKKANLRETNLKGIDYDAFTDFEDAQFNAKTVLPNGLLATKTTIPNNATWVNE